MGSGKWKEGSGKWKVESGKREVGSGKWKVGSGKREEMTKNICFCGKFFLTLQMRIMHTYANNLLCMCSVITFEKIKL